MPKRKYTRARETPSKYECTKRSCKWEGTKKEKAHKMEEDWLVHICPECGNDEFYGII